MLCLAPHRLAALMDALQMQANTSSAWKALALFQDLLMTTFSAGLLHLGMCSIVLWFHAQQQYLWGVHVAHTAWP